MTFRLNKLLELGLILLVLTLMTVHVNSHARPRPYNPPGVKRLTDLFSHVSINQSFSTVYGGQNIKLLNNGSFVNLALDKSSGAGLVSKDKYHYGFFSAAIKLPAGLTSGVVVAFYLSNAEAYPHNHDEIDIELLGHDQRNDWVFQTNVYANGSTGTGREEKFYLWFDPTAQYHLYSIIWNSHHTVFLVDNVPVREFVHNAAYPSVYPSKPMSLYATIWDASEWATHGGKYPVNYKYAPFVASLGEFELDGCVTTTTTSPTSSLSSTSSSSPPSPCAKTAVSSLDPVEGPDFVALSGDQSSAMDWARRKLMFYSYCSDVHRYKVMPPECK